MEREEFNRLLDKLKEDYRVWDTRVGLQGNAFIRTVNFHSTPAIDRDFFDGQLAWFSQHFSTVDVDDVDRFLDTGRWHKEKPGLMIAIFEGFRNHYDVIYPLLQKYGLTAWFHIPAFYPDVPVADQRQFSLDHQLHVTHAEDYPDGRFAMTWEEIGEIARDHVLCCHSGTHFRIQLDTPDEILRYEIFDSRQRMVEITGQEVPVFCWLYGEEYSYNPRAAVYVKEAGYRYVIGNLKMERIALKDQEEHR